MLTIYTAAIGDTDTVQAPRVLTPGARYLCFSDRPCPAPYEWIQVPTADNGSIPSRAFKVLANDARLLDADATLWHDASYCLDDVTVFDRLPIDLATMAHPRRSRLEDEARAVARYGYVTLDAALKRAATYRAIGFTRNVLSSGGLIFRRRSAAVRAFNRLWWCEVQHWGGRDQASFDYAAWRMGVPVTHVVGTPRQNPYGVWRGVQVSA